jgi:hypothetical protein
MSASRSYRRPLWALKPSLPPAGLNPACRSSSRSRDGRGALRAHYGLKELPRHPSGPLHHRLPRPLENFTETKPRPAMRIAGVGKKFRDAPAHGPLVDQLPVDGHPADPRQLPRQLGRRAQLVHGVLQKPGSALGHVRRELAPLDSARHHLGELSDVQIFAAQVTRPAAGRWSAAPPRSSPARRRAARRRPGAGPPRPPSAAARQQTRQAWPRRPAPPPDARPR